MKLKKDEGELLLHLNSGLWGCLSNGRRRTCIKAHEGEGRVVVHAVMYGRVGWNPLQGTIKQSSCRDLDGSLDS